jgi:putative copper export protein
MGMSTETSLPRPESVRQQLQRRARRVTVGFVILMTAGFGALLLFQQGESELFDNPAWLIVLAAAIGYVYTMRCDCPRCRGTVAGVYGKVPPACPWCALPFDRPYP